MIKPCYTTLTDLDLLQLTSTSSKLDSQLNVLFMQWGQVRMIETLKALFSPLNAFRQLK